MKNLEVMVNTRCTGSIIFASILQASVRLGNISDLAFKKIMKGFPWVEINSKNYAFPIAERSKTQLR